MVALTKSMYVELYELQAKLAIFFLIECHFYLIE